MLLSRSVTPEPMEQQASAVPTPEPTVQQASAALTQGPAMPQATAAPTQGPIVQHAVDQTVHLPRLWAENIPQEDQKWVAAALFQIGSSGKQKLRDNLRLWYHPPPPANISHQPPTPARYFSHDLLVWMPYKLWGVKFVCSNPQCRQQQLTGAGLHKRARQVLDLDRVYFMVGETLSCSLCKASYVSWSQTLLQQLDLAHRLEFRVILTQK